MGEKGENLSIGKFNYTIDDSNDYNNIRKKYTIKSIHINYNEKKEQTVKLAKFALLASASALATYFLGSLAMNEVFSNEPYTHLASRILKIEGTCMSLSLVSFGICVREIVDAIGQIAGNKRSINYYINSFNKILAEENEKEGRSLWWI